MTPEDLAEIESLEADAKRLYGQMPSFMQRVQWLCALVRRLDASEAVPDDRDKVLQTLTARVKELEERLSLTPDRVLALERAQLKGRDDRRKPEKPSEAETPVVGAPTIVTDDTIVPRDNLKLHTVPNRLPVQKQ